MRSEMRMNHCKCCKTLLLSGNTLNILQVDVPRARAKKFKNEMIMLIREAWTQEILSKRPIGKEDLIGPCMVMNIGRKLGLIMKIYPCFIMSLVLDKN